MNLVAYVVSQVKYDTIVEESVRFSYGALQEDAELEKLFLNCLSGCITAQRGFWLWAPDWRWEKHISCIDNYLFIKVKLFLK